MRDRRYLVLIPIAALLAILPLIFRGCSCGHDFSFHLLSWLEVHAQWRQGILLPHWEFSAAWNSGEPRFVFYPPLSWLTGATASFFLPWTAIPNTFIWLALTTCGYTTYHLAREWASESSALIAACFSMVHPYMLFTLYERSAYAELLAAAWIPLLLLALLRPRCTIPRVAAPVALLWLTNDPAAVMGCYLLALLAVLRIAWIYRIEKNLRNMLREAIIITLGTILGLALAGFYLVPAIVEQQWVRIRVANVQGVRIQDNFLFGQSGSPSHKAILLTASLCSITLLILIAVFAALALIRNSEKLKTPNLESRRFAIFALLIAALAIAFLLTAPSNFLWSQTPKLHYLQFPWRFDACLGAITAALLALALGPIQTRPRIAIAFALAIPLLFSLGGNSLFRQICNGGKDVRSLVASFDRGDAPHSDDYTPAGSNPQAIGHSNPNTWIAKSANSQPTPDTSVKRSIALKDRLHFQVSSPVPAFLVVNIRDYPAWKIEVNGITSTIHPHRTDGLIAVPIPAGSSQINLSYKTTPDQIFGWALTTLACIVLLWIFQKERGGTSRPYALE